MAGTLFLIFTVVALYWFPIRRWMNQWGATSSDLARNMAGDILLPDWTYSGTTAVTVNARPARLLTHAIEPAGFLMTRRMLLGLRDRSEGLRAASMSETRTDRRPAA